MIKRLTNCVLLGTLLASLTACDSGESTIPEQPDLTPNAGSSSGNPRDLTGKVIDGYLRYARVWLDINENFQWDDGEPLTMSGQGGEFTFTVAQMGELGSPRNYRIMAQALPGITVDEENLVDNNESLALVEKAFVLAAPPGSANVTPLSTLVVAEYDYLKETDNQYTYGQAHNNLKHRLFADINSFLTANVIDDDWRTTAERLQSMAEENLLQDFVNTSNYNIWAFAKALVIAQQNVLDGLPSDVSNNFLTNIDGGATRAALSGILQASSTVFQNIAFWAGDIEGQEGFESLDFSLQSDLLDLEIDLANPTVLHERVWHVSANSSSLAIEGELVNSLSLFPIPANLSIDNSYSAVSLDELLINTKEAGKVLYSRTPSATIHSTYLDGGVDFHYRLTPEETARVITEFNPFTTEIIEPDGVWDLSARVVHIDYPPDEDNDPNNGPPADGVRLLVDAIENPVLSQFTSLLTDSTADTSLAIVNGSVVTHNYKVGNAAAYMTHTFTYDGPELQSAFFETELEDTFRYVCTSSGRTDSIRIFTAQQADASTACSSSPDFSLTQFYYTPGDLAVMCHSSSVLPGKHLCEFPLVDENGRITTVITVLRSGAISEDLNPNNGQLLLVEERRYTTLSKAIDLEFDVVEEVIQKQPESDGDSSSEEGSGEDTADEVIPVIFNYIETLLPSDLETL